MSHAITYSGPTGSIKWGYREIATVGAWSLVADATGGDLTSRVVAPHDAFGVTQAPLRFVVPRPTTTWEWPIESLQIADDGAVHARVGPPKE